MTSTEETENYTLLGEIKNYNDEKELLYNKLKINNINYLINDKDLKLSNEFESNLLTLATDDKLFNKFSDFFNREYENNTSIGSYFNDKINEINNLIENKKEELNLIKTSNQKKIINSQTNKKKLDHEYNIIINNKIKKHILLIIICSLILLNLFMTLKYYCFINNFVFILLCCIIIMLKIIYIMHILYSKYPREANDYHKFKFK
jgi:hypothetical protein